MPDVVKSLLYCITFQKVPKDNNLTVSPTLTVDENPEPSNQIIEPPLIVNNDSGCDVLSSESTISLPWLFGFGVGKVTLNKVLLVLFIISSWSDGWTI